MTNKDQLQKELKEKIKEGIKPSDLRSKLSSLNKGDNLKKKPVIEENNEDYESEEETIPTPPPLSNQQIKDLQTEISSLQKQLQTYKDFKEADMKIKEKLKEEIEQ